MKRRIISLTLALTMLISLAQGVPAFTEEQQPLQSVCEHDHFPGNDPCTEGPSVTESVQIKEQTEKEDAGATITSFVFENTNGNITECLSGAILNSKTVVDYLDDSFVIDENNSVILKNWKSNSLKSLDINNARSLAVDGNYLIIAVVENSLTKFLCYDISDDSYFTFLTFQNVIDSFSVHNNVLYCQVAGNIYSADLQSGTEKTIYDKNDVGNFYIYDNDILCLFITPDEQIIQNDETPQVTTDAIYDPYKLLLLNTGELIDKTEYESKIVQQMSSTKDVSYSAVIGNISLPFSDYPSGSYWTTNGEACNSHDKCKRYYYDPKTGRTVDLLSWQCMSFAHHVFYRVFGVLDRGSAAYKNVVYNVPASAISVNYLRSIFGVTALPGANIRTNAFTGSWGHSLIYMGSDNTYIYTYEGNMDGRCRVSVIRRTWAEMVSYLSVTKPGIEYIHMPNTYPSNRIVPPPCQAPSIVQASYIGGKTVTISAESGATIYYTTDGSNPTTSSARYTGAFNLTSSATIKAMAAKSGYNNSAIASVGIAVSAVSNPVISGAYTSQNMQVTISCATSGATIYYTTDGSAPTTNSAKYTGGFAVTGNTTVKAVAVASGYANSGVSTSNITLSVPSVPTIQLENTNAVIAVGDSVSVRWTTPQNATGYEARLYNNGGLVNTVATTGTTASFKLENEGKYTIAVKANNFVGLSSESTPVSVTAKAPLKVTFTDFDGTVISEQMVRYGYGAVAPELPSRKGYTFSGWSTTEYRTVTQEMTISATYSINKYTVTFYDVDGTTLLNTQRVEYGSPATPPTNYTLPIGFVFAGWFIDYGSDGTDYTAVDGNMKLIATKKWSNDDLPVIINIIDAFRDDSGKTYTTNVKVTNYPNAATRGKLIATLKTNENKAVQSQVITFDVDASAERSFTIIIPYTDKATKLEVVAVGLETDNNTGGSYSVIKSSAISARMTWGEWSEWSTNTPPETADAKESKTQYSGRNKETTISSQNPLSGWILEKDLSYNGTTQGPSQSHPGDKTGRNISTSWVAPTYKTQYLFSGYRDYTNWTHFCEWLGEYNRGTNFYYQDTGWLDYDIGLTSMTSQYCSHCGVRIYGYYAANGTRYYFRYTRQVQTGGGYNLYYWTDKVYSYQYYRWTDWSGWSDTPVSGNETRTQVVNRYRNLVPMSDPNAGTEDTSGESYTISGNIKNVETDFSGKLATVMVYKKTNSDPTEEQLQYVGQITLGAGNSYNLEFKTKENPSEKTGDFIVALGIEGADKLVNVDVIRAPRPQYSVKFIADGQEISVQTVSKGDSAVAPEVPEKEGHTFIKWNENTTNVSQDLIITAQYAKNMYSVMFADFENDTLKISKSSYGSPIVMPAAPTAKGKKFIGWQTTIDGQKVDVDESYIVTNDVLFTSLWESEKYTVKFVDQNGDEILEATQLVEYGKAAVLPNDLVVPGYVFKGWNNTKAWWNVESDLTIYPIVEREQTAEAPMYDVYVDEAMNALYLASVTEKGKIYYTTDGTEPSLESSVYDPAENSAIYITSDATIKAFTVAEGYNDSEVITMDISYQQYAPYIDPTAPQIQVGSISGKPGDLIDIPVSIANNPGVATFNLKLNFDNTKLTPISITQDSSWANGSITSNLQEGGDVSALEYVTAYWVNTTNVLTDGNLFTVRFRIKEDATESVIPITVTYNPDDISNQSFENVNLAVANGAVTLFTYIFGDIFEDNIINAKDGLLLSQHLAGWSSALLSARQEQAADVFYDGLVNAKDGLKLSQYLAGWDVLLGN